MVTEVEQGKGGKRQKIVGTTPLNIKILWLILPFLCGVLAYYIDTKLQVSTFEANERNDAKYTNKEYIKFLERRISKLEDKVIELGRRTRIVSKSAP